MKVLGYLEGTDPNILTSVMLEGYETLPLSNGWDNHGKHLTLLNPADNISLVVGSLHKFLRLEDMSIFSAMLATVKAYDIPVLFVTPKDFHDKAAKLIDDKELKYEFVDPANLSEAIMAKLAG
jgi:hypothetical protein